MFPETLWCLLNVAIVIAQTRRQLSLNDVSSFDESSTFTLPESSNLTVSVALCSSASSARFFVTNTSADADDPGLGGGTDVYEILLNEGYGNFAGVFTNGGVLAAENTSDVTFEVGVSESGPMHKILTDPPSLGDTTATQAIIFSPVFLEADSEVPTYPNYSLPSANLSIPTIPPTSNNFSLIFSETSGSSPLTSKLQTGCALRSQNSTGNIVNQTFWLPNEDGWRTQWIIDDLTPATNYTAYVIIDNTVVSGPMYFLTKSALESFSCPLLSNLPYCPQHRVCGPSLPTIPAINLRLLPISLHKSQIPLISSLTNFTITLTTFACGRDDYSPLVSCNDCQREYRRWLCTISFPRCGEANSNNGTIVASDGAQKRCNAADRACPSFLGFRCPTEQFNASSSYGTGVEGEGSSGTSQDRYGNVWCNYG
ncbi:stretch-activated Ca2+-permeable channel component-domain-containing protein [Desarmillaria tabescens]|uniref:Stretch-activated Ca2+-permeable channel component-domain-containing protein n=1 Tax=Armillaria tabescens TaxID=1929756 RepID=A0AA39JRL7_ARMTA|nr:stretch-activated Ca2+-permeable channel component-domain-containing protein [Desarmillaria tabescens]KAK0447449.1 stretch-activated Ca2+-permeable channel component-domain-containing protein [Desarmillaria tabescens]